MTTLKHPVVSFSLVFLQFGLIAALLLLLPLNLHPLVLGVQAAAVLIGLWAVKVMHLGHFNVVPDPQPDIELVTHGPYRFIRHPMYFSIVLFFLPLVAVQPDLWTLGLYAALWLVLLLKLHYEEYLLIEMLPEYDDYRQTSKRIVPFVF